METIGDRVKRLREAKQLSQAQLADAAGVSQGTISQQEANPTMQSKFLPQIAHALGVDVKVLLGITPIPLRADEDREPYDVEVKYVYVPVLGVEIAAGNGTHSDSEEVEGKHSYAVAWLRSEALDSAQLRRAKARGRSMEPTICDGDSILINLAERKISNGRVYAFRIGDELRVKRLYRQMDGKVRVVSDNTDKMQYPDEYLSEQDFPEIIGRIRDRSGTTNL